MNRDTTSLSAAVRMQKLLAALALLMFWAACDSVPIVGDIERSFDAGTCAQGLVSCAGGCVNPDSDRVYCGAGDDCSSDPGESCKAGEVCDGNGRCSVVCQPGRVNCDGNCIDPSTSQTHCGAGANCASAPGTACAEGELCDGSGVCRTSCQGGLSECGGECVNPAVDERYCGAGSDCAAQPGVACAAGQLCNGSGLCELSCQQGLVDCAGICVNPDSDRGHCGAGLDCSTEPGAACPSGEVCNGAGECQTSCIAGHVDCQGSCVDPATDRTHCGAGEDCTADPGVACAAGELCNGSGECEASCSEGFVNCAGRCIDPSSDEAHCGAQLDCSQSPGEACAAGETCEAGSCSPSCLQGLVECDGTCVDPLTSPTHCGAQLGCDGNGAGVQCAPGQVCNGAGVCQLSCQQGLVDCAGTCVDPNTSDAHCGAGVDCNAQPGTACAQGSVCNGSGVCELSCQQGLVECNGVCINPNTDRAFCGAGPDCSVQDGSACRVGEVCNGAGQCQLSCQEGLVNCGGKCIDPATDLTFCGAGNDCVATPGASCIAGQVCSGGACQLTCQAGLVDCNGKCIDPRSDEAHCGAGSDCSFMSGVVCSAGQVCDEGACELSCQPGLINCQGTCVDPSVSRQYCGAGPDCSQQPGTLCPTGQVCNGAGACELSCQLGLVNCGGTCVDPDTDEQHCGAGPDCAALPGEACEAGEICNGSGTCQLTCQPGLIACAGTCIDPDLSNTFCGAGPDCSTNPGSRCAAGEICNGSGVCELSCQAGLVNCAGTCVDPSSDEAHCGAGMDCAVAPGTSCAVGQSCLLGACVLTCPSGQVNCQGKCIDPATDQTYCGAGADCSADPGATCPAGSVCNGSGVCELSCQAGLVNCAGTCIDPDESRQFCGAGANCTTSPGAACGPRELCDQGTCEELPRCLSDELECDDSCRKVASDPDYCGDCTTRCLAPTLPHTVAACSAGACNVQCETGWADCDGDLTSPVSDGCEVELAVASCVFTLPYTGAVHIITIPAGISSVDAQLDGAQGGTAVGSSRNYGGRVTATIPVVAGDVLYVYVGGKPTGAAGGFNGGGAGDANGRGGGGGTDIRLNGTSLTDRILVAGGGGGAGAPESGQQVLGGQGGGLSGTGGSRGTTLSGGGGGTQVGSANGTCGSDNSPSVAGGFGFGGTAAGCGCDGYGGGGGWYGGGGSGNCRGGGGGSGYAAASLSGVVFTVGAAASGHGSARLSF